VQKSPGTLGEEASDVPCLRKAEGKKKSALDSSRRRSCTKKKMFKRKGEVTPAA